MNADQIKKILNSELQERDSFDWPEEWAEKIEEYLIEPFEGNFYLPETGDFEDFWVLADLDPENPTDGLVLIYDVETDLFGLGKKGRSIRSRLR